MNRAFSFMSIKTDLQGSGDGFTDCTDKFTDLQRRIYSLEGRIYGVRQSAVNQIVNNLIGDRFAVLRACEPAICKNVPLLVGILIEVHLWIERNIVNA